MSEECPTSIKERRQALAFLKKQRGCAQCRESDPVCLDFHHIDSASKLFTIGEAVTNTRITFEELLQEITKCVVLCRNCHAKLHRKGGRWTYVEPDY